jgi:predicted alpha/beta-fold hydrolase
MHELCCSLKVNVPFCVVHALDDPLLTWRNVASDKHGLFHPTRLTKENPNMFLLLTKRGGHVGWSTGWLPFVNKWKWMSTAPAGFIDAVLKSQKNGD